MCGRFSNRLSWREMVELYRITEPDIGHAPNLRARYNVAPTQDVPIVRPHPTGREFAMVRWGLVPSWSKGPDARFTMINARADTVVTKPAYRSAFRTRRCLIPADGFYEWKGTGKVKQPYHFTLKDGGGFAFAGLWERWEKGPEPIESCTIITTDANELVAEVHPRMPVILAAESYEPWLTGEAGTELLMPYPAAAMRAAKVSTRVNSAKTDEPSMIEPLAEGA